MYQALYRKWRPRTFDEVVGQPHITHTLKQQVAVQRLSHAYLFTGTRGTGKTSCAKILARAINCQNPQDGNPCNQCPACLGIENGSILDVLELDAASNNGVDQVRALRDEAVYTPAAVKKRVYIVDEVHMLSTPAFNALLKILEEPPPHLVFILATTEVHKVPATIKSRCQQFAFKRLHPEEIAARLSHVAAHEQLALSPQGAALLARMANGGLRDALSLLDQCSLGGQGEIDEQIILDTLGLVGNLETARLMEQIARRESAAALETLSTLYMAGKEVAGLLDELSVLARDLLLRKTAPQGGAALLGGGYDEQTMRTLGQLFTAPRLMYLLTCLQNTLAELPRSANRRTGAELCLLRLCDEQLDESVAALSARITQLEQQLSQKGASAPAADTQARAQAAPTAPKQAPVSTDSPPWEVSAPPAIEPKPQQEKQQQPKPQPEKQPSPSVAAPAQENSASPAATQSNVSFSWQSCAEQLHTRAPIALRTYISDPDKTVGVLAGNLLTLWVESDWLRDMFMSEALCAPFTAAIKSIVGEQTVLRVSVGKPPQTQGQPQQAAPPQNAQGEGHDAMDALLALGEQFDNITINE